MKSRGLSGPCPAVPFYREANPEREGACPGSYKSLDPGVPGASQRGSHHPRLLIGVKVAKSTSESGLFIL